MELALCALQISYATPTQAMPHRRKWEVLTLKIIHRRHSTGFEQDREVALHVGDVIAGRYKVGGWKGRCVCGGEGCACGGRERGLALGGWMEG